MLLFILMVLCVFGIVGWVYFLWFSICVVNVLLSLLWSSVSVFWGNFLIVYSGMCVVLSVIVCVGYVLDSFLSVDLGFFFFLWMKVLLCLMMSVSFNLFCVVMIFCLMGMFFELLGFGLVMWI